MVFLFGFTRAEARTGHERSEKNVPVARFGAELVVQVGYFQDQAQEVRDIAAQVEREISGAEEPTWQVEFYPNESAAGIIEILLKN